MTRDHVLRRRADRGGSTARARGRLKIGDDWNAITIIALSQSNPMKAVAELIENSIDAKARSVTVTRGREGGRHYLSIKDDGEGVPKDAGGLPDFRYVATHICDSVKRRLKQDGVAGLQGEFGIGLLSFWTIGEELAMTSAGGDFADGVIAYDGNWLGGETFVSFDKRAVALMRQQGQRTRLLA